MSKCSSTFTKNTKILVTFGDYIWNRHEKCIQMSTNMPNIGLVFLDISFLNRQKIVKSKSILYGKPDIA